MNTFCEKRVGRMRVSRAWFAPLISTFFDRMRFEPQSEDNFGRVLQFLAIDAHKLVQNRAPGGPDAGVAGLVGLLDERLLQKSIPARIRQLTQYISINIG